ncbi:MAG TPA: universal stress protein [Gemmatimonadaceae bacterium]|nr:universal stress protein [Gemmatimonadaceae bacterium]
MKLPAAGPSPFFRKVLVATDGRPLADGALRVAHAVAERTGAALEEAAIFEPRVPVPGAGVSRGSSQCEEMDAPELAALASKVREQRRRIAGTGPVWPVHLAVGYPASMIERIAEREQSDLIVAGIGRGGPDVQVFTKETALALAFSADVPVLATAHDADGLPRRALVVVDFDDTSLRAARLVQELVADDATIHLLHVSRNAATTNGAVRRLFEEAEGTGAARGIEFRRTVVEGDAATETLAAAEQWDVGLIVAPLKGATVVQRSLGDTLAAPLLRGSSCSVLIVPEGPVERSRDAEVARRPGETS